MGLPCECLEIHAAARVTALKRLVQLRVPVHVIARGGDASAIVPSGQMLH
jgi:hypothetical protein